MTTWLGNLLNRQNFERKTEVDVAVYVLAADDIALMVKRTATSACTITLPTVQVIDNRVVWVFDMGNAGANNITIDTQGAELINGAATLVLSSNYAWAKIVAFDGNWYAAI